MKGDKHSRLEQILGELKPENKKKEICEVRGLPPGQFLDEDVYLCEIRHEIPREVDVNEHKQCIKTLSSWGAGEPLVFFDLETTGLAGGTGTYAFLAGVGFYEKSEFVIRQLFLCSPRAERAWLSWLLDIMPPKPAFVTYNGKNFDLPLINTRFLLSRMKPIEESGHLDLLHLVRRLWKRRIGSCTLSNVERQILYIDRKTEDVPGCMIPELYKMFLKTGDAAALSGVFYHNEMDILSLCMLFYKVALTLMGNSADPFEIDRAGDAWCDRDLNRANRLWKKAATLEPPAKNAIWKLAMENKKMNNYYEALSLLMKLYNMDYKKIDVAVEISKLYEHKLKDPQTALMWAESAIKDFLKYRPLVRAQQSKWTELLKRAERLRRKVG
jgi:uncharacterized protein YprB with RNaseH-like and TPR domain